METELLFQAAPDQAENTAAVVTTGTDETGWYLVPAATCFYFGGGGQPQDEGSVSVGLDAARVPFSGARLVDGQVRHYPASGELPVVPGDAVVIRINAPLRQLHRQLHTAGHLISSVIYEELHPELVPTKGYHFREGSYVELQAPAGVRDLDLAAVNERLAEHLAAGLSVRTQQVSPESPEYAAAFRTPGFNPPAGKPLRLVTIGPFLGYLCGGTHLANTSELVALRVTATKFKKGLLRVKYEVA